MARPPRVITLIDRPSAWNTRAVTASDSGIAVSEITVVRTFSRKRNSTMATRIAPSRSASRTLLTEASMKSAWRNETSGADRPGGSVRARAASADSTTRVSAIESAPGCFCTLTMTAGCPFSPASPRLKAGAKRTPATCSSSTGGWPLRCTGRRCRSSSRVLRPTWRISTSRAFCSRKPPLLLPAKPRSADSSAEKLTPSCAMRAGSGSTRNCRTSPPIGMTCATPGIDSRRGRSTKSAYSRTCIALTRAGSAGSATSMISPITEATGPRLGLSPGGSCSRAAASRSATSWRLR